MNPGLLGDFTVQYSCTEGDLILIPTAGSYIWGARYWLAHRNGLEMD